MPNTEKHDKLGKASLEHDNNKKNSIYEHCNAPKVGKIYFSDPFMCFSRQSLSRVEGICFLRKHIPRKWGNVFSRHLETSSQDTWKRLLKTLGNVFLGNSTYNKI